MINLEHGAAPRKLFGYLLGFLAAVALASEAMRFSGNVAVLWPANGILCVALFRLEDKWQRCTILALAAAGNVVLNLIYGHTPTIALVVGGVNVAEAFIAWAMIARICPNAVRFESTAQLINFSVAAVFGAPAIPSLVAATAFSAAYGVSFFKILATWWVADALGLVMVVPAVMLFQDRHRYVGFNDTLGHVTASILAISAMTCFVFAQSTYPLLFVLFPCLSYVAFQLGPVWSAVSALLMSAIAFVLTSNGLGPASLISGASMPDRIQFVQFFISVAFLSTLPKAYLLAEQARLRDQLRMREGETREAKEKAERAANAKSEFLATMSHEIRNPLNSIIGYTRMALSRPGLDIATKRDMEVVEDASLSLLGIVNDVLDYSALEGGHLRLNSTSEMICDAFEDAVKLMRVPATDKGVELVLDIDARLREHVGFVDARRLRQVLVNLIGNAIKHTDHGRVIVKAELIEITDSEVSVRASVTDDGPGIPAFALGTLFVRFSQLDSSRSRKYGGTGLGLAICKGLITEMGGHIGVNSSVGKGSTFWFEIPIALDRDKRVATTAALPQMKKAPEKLRVLVVDDLDLTRELTASVLDVLGHTVATASGGNEAVAMVRSNQFDVVLMDVQMPGMDGLEAAQAIRGLEEPGNTVPIIAMTANVLPNEIALCLSAGMDDHIGKPFEWSALAEKVQAVVDRRPQARCAPAA